MRSLKKTDTKKFCDELLINKPDFRSNYHNIRYKISNNIIIIYGQKVVLNPLDNFMNDRTPIFTLPFSKELLRISVNNNIQFVIEHECISFYINEIWYRFVYYNLLDNKSFYLFLRNFVHRYSFVNHNPKIEKLLKTKNTSLLVSKIPFDIRSKIADY